MDSAELTSPAETVERSNRGARQPDERTPVPVAAEEVAATANVWMDVRTVDVTPEQLDEKFGAGCGGLCVRACCDRCLYDYVHGGRP